MVYSLCSTGALSFGEREGIEVESTLDEVRFRESLKEARWLKTNIFAELSSTYFQPSRFSLHARFVPAVFTESASCDGADVDNRRGGARGPRQGARSGEQKHGFCAREQRNRPLVSRQSLVRRETEYRYSPSGWLYSRVTAVGSIDVSGKGDPSRSETRMLRFGACACV